MDSTAHINTDLVSFGYSESTYVMTDYALHCHNFYEVFYFLSGDADYLVEGVNYQPTPGSVLLLSPHAFHGVRVNSTAPYRRYSLHFHPDLLLPERRDFLLRAFPQTGENAPDSLFILNILNNFICCPIWKVLNPVLVKAMNFRHRCFQSA